MAGKIREHMEIIGADGVHVGTVDRVDGDNIKLTKKDSGEGSHRGHHHTVPLSLVAEVEGNKVRLSANADVAVTFEEEARRDLASGRLISSPGGTTRRETGRSRQARQHRRRAQWRAPSSRRPLRRGRWRRHRKAPCRWRRWRARRRDRRRPACVGQIARVKPSCAAIASRLAAAAVSTASVAMTAIVVFRAGRLVAEFQQDAPRIGMDRRRVAVVAELVADLEGRCPEMPAAADGHRAGRVHRRERADMDAAVEYGRGRAQPALQAGGQRAGARADRADGKILRGALCSFVSQLAVGRIAAPVLVAAIREIEQDGAAARWGRDCRAR